MRAPVSIVLPTLNAQHDLSAALSSIYDGLTDGILRDVIFSDGGSEDETAAIAREMGANFILGPAGRGGQLKRGAEASSAEWLLFLHADTTLPDNWPDHLRTHMAAHPDQALAFRLAFRDGGLRGRIVAAWANLRTRLLGMPFGDQGLFISRALYEKVGGYADMPLMEDVAIARALKGRLKISRAAVQTSSARYQKRGWCVQGASNLLLQIRFLFGADPLRLAKAYRRD